MTESRLRLAALALSAVGVAVAAYLTVVHYADAVPICVGGDDAGCARVQTSEYAIFLGVPVPVLGLLGYAAIAATSLPRGVNWAGTAAFLALGGFGFSLYLTYLELFVIEAICQWCVVSAVLMTALAIVTTARVAKT